MIDNKVLEQNIRLIQNVLSQQSNKKRLLSKSRVSFSRRESLIDLIKNEWFPLIPSYLKDIQRNTTLQLIHGALPEIKQITNLIIYQRTSAQISGSNTLGFHPDAGQMIVHLVGTPVVMANEDIHTVVDQNGIRWVVNDLGNSMSDQTYKDWDNPMYRLFGKKVSLLYHKHFKIFIEKIKNMTNIQIIRYYFKVFLKEFLQNNKTLIASEYLRMTTQEQRYAMYYSQYIITNYIIKKVIFLPSYESYDNNRINVIDKKIIEILKNHNIPYLIYQPNQLSNPYDPYEESENSPRTKLRPDEVVDNYINDNIPRKYRIGKSQEFNINDR